MRRFVMTTIMSNNVIPTLCLMSFVMIFAISCDVKIEKEKQQRENSEQQYKTKLKRAATLNIWWNERLNNAPTHANYPHLTKLSKENIDTVYSYFMKEAMNTSYGGDGRFNSLEKRLAEQFNVHYKTFDEAASFMALEYLPYLDKIVKEYFLAHKNTIIPDYYGSIGSTAFVGDYTFSCTLKLKTCKDSYDLDQQIEEHIGYLKQSLPGMISGFKIFDIAYECEKTGTEGSFDIGYIWRREDDTLLRKKSSSGTYGGHRLPEENTYWHEPSWNNKQVLNNNTKGLVQVFRKLN